MNTGWEVWTVCSGEQSGLLCPGWPLGQWATPASSQSLQGFWVCVKRNPAPHIGRGVPFLLALSSWARWRSLGENVASLLIFRALESGWEVLLPWGMMGHDSLGGRAACHWIAGSFLLWVDKFKINSVHQKILKVISLGKTKWVFSWPYFNAEIGIPQLSMTCLPKAFCESWCNFSGTQCCACWSRPQMSPRELMLCHCCPEVPHIFHLHPPRNDLGTGTSSCSPLAMYLAQQACSYLRDFSTAVLCLGWSSLMNVHDCFLLLNEEST